MKRILCLLVALTILGSSALFADWYIPLNQVPQAVVARARQTYPQAQIWAVEMEHYNVYKVKMSNMMELYIDKAGNLLGQEWDD
ncbi:PepSY-like domain-containing protein [uncultured Brachyspira sp.]|uniref:PepSY-like domain-containing protein n=1 Tax=uncultured Brachyspira sp. TaxID=221953 RepID=UPI0026224F9F|nr:PepSY-like domain-containing protein [uncultured Brachyspira sp.]